MGIQYIATVLSQGKIRVLLHYLSRWPLQPWRLIDRKIGSGCVCCRRQPKRHLSRRGTAHLGKFLGDRWFRCKQRDTGRVPDRNAWHGVRYTISSPRRPWLGPKFNTLDGSQGRWPHQFKIIRILVGRGWSYIKRQNGWIVDPWRI